MEIHIEQNVWTIIFLIAAMQGSLLGAILLHKKQKELGLIVLSYSLLLSYYVMFWTGLSKQVSPAFGVLGGLTFLIAPLFFAFTKDQKISNWHFTPAVLFSGLYLLSISSNFQFNGWLPVFQVAQLAIYSYLIFRTEDMMNWHKQVALSYHVFTGGFTLYYMLVWTGQLRIEYDYFISMIMTGFIYWVGYKALLNPIVDKKPESKTMAYSQAFAESVTQKIEDWIESQQRFLDSEYKITDLSSELDTSVHTLSHIINSKYGRGFNDWLNERRINHAKSLISQNPEEKLISIAYQSGFNNKVSFIKNFKKHTGMTPTAFKDSLKG